MTSTTGSAKTKHSYPVCCIMLIFRLICDGEAQPCVRLSRWAFCDFHQSCPENTGVVINHKPRPFPFMTFPCHH